MIDQKTNDGQTVLDFAFEYHENVVLQLFKLCPSQMDVVVSDWVGAGCTVLHLAAEQGLDAVVAHILAVKPQLINTVARNGKTPLHCAANSKDNLAVVTRLLAASPALINALDNSGKTALHHAASFGDLPVAEHLLATSPELIHAVDSLGVSVLHNAVLFGQRAMAEYFLALRPSLIGIRTAIGDTVLHAAANHGHNAMAEHLLALRPELIHAVNNRGWTVLHVATLSGQSAMVDYLLSVSPALIDAVDKSGQTPLHSVAFETRHPKLPIARALLAVKPELIAMKDSKGSTVLHFAAEHCKSSKELIEELWRRHPEALRAANELGRTPFHIAVEKDNDLAIELFQWTLTLEEIKFAYDSYKGKSSYEARFRSVMETKCESLSLWLLPDVVGTVFEYLSFNRAKRTGVPISSPETRES